jgi:multidrug efflux pump subunit AcrA (membrane-fusion protein)
VERSVALLRPGAFVQINVVTDVHPDALVVPRAALVAEGRRWLLFRVKADGKTVESLEVELGFEEGDRVEILDTLGTHTDGKLKAGDSIVILGASALSDGAPVRILERDEPDAKSKDANDRGAMLEDGSTPRVAALGKQAS